jgi:hypothetical protein
MVPRGREDGPTDMKKLIAAFRNFAHAPKTHDYIETTHKVRGTCKKQNFLAFDFCVSQLLCFLQDLALVVGVKCNRCCSSVSVRWYPGDNGDKYKCNGNGNGNGNGKLVPRKSRSVIRFLWALDISPIEIQRQLLWMYAWRCMSENCAESSKGQPRWWRRLPQHAKNLLEQALCSPSDLRSFAPLKEHIGNRRVRKSEEVGADTRKWLRMLVMAFYCEGILQTHTKVG